MGHSTGSPQTWGLDSTWNELSRKLGAAEGAVTHEAFADLAARHAEPWRHYHTLKHVASVVSAVRQAGARHALLLAAFFHDAIYDPRAADNEERSAAHAGAVLRKLGVPEATVAETERLILLTKTHVAEAGDADGQLLLDADLAILGSKRSEYRCYAESIRQEYGWVPEPQYRAGRTAILENFLKRKNIYRTGFFAPLEIPARDNLRWEIESLIRGV